jgi:GTPase SAR1 family protein
MFTHIEFSQALEIANRYRILIVGARGSGSSNLVMRVWHDRFADEYDGDEADGSYVVQATVDGAACAILLYETYKNGDVAAQYRNADALIAMYSVVDRQSFQELPRIGAAAAAARNDAPCALPVVLFGNKSDLQSERQVSSDEAQRLATEWQCEWIEGSCKSCINIDRVVEATIRRAQQFQQQQQQAAEAQNKSHQRTKAKCQVM